jgi:predicted ATPase/DNA-binding winged helix-turn-helix (wHTH) protein
MQNRAMDPPRDSAVLRFGDFELDVAGARLRRGDTPLALPPKSFELLVFLARRPGTLVLKDELLDAVWGRRFVSEGAVKTVVSELRAALGDDARDPTWIETVQRRGYRFKGEVQAVTAPAHTSAGVVPSAATAGATGAAPAPGLPPRGNLPLALPPLIGRDDDLAALSARLDADRVLTLTGPGGVGKTRLALEAAHSRRDRHPDGVWLLALAPLTAAHADARSLRTALARTLHIAPTGTDSDDVLVRALRGQSMLLVLDNAEHVLAGLADWLAQLLPHLPDLRLLVTSREPLQIPGEQVWRVAPLSLPQGDDAAAWQASSAVRLFVDRVAARLAGFEPEAGQQAAVARICRALDGLPLALELAAARVPVLGVHGLAEHLTAPGDAGPRLQLLTQGARTAPPHQRTLRATLDWSHALLTPAEQRVFRRLAVFRGGCTLDAAQAVCADPDLDAWAVIDVVTALVDKSMAVSVSTADAPGRIVLLESLRAYARERLEAATEVDVTHRRHLRHMRAYWAAADAVALDEAMLPWTARHIGELDNLRSVLGWANATLGTRDDAGVEADLLALVGLTAKFWQRAGLASEGGRWCLAVTVRADPHPDPVLRAGVDLAIGSLCRFTPLLSPPETLVRAQRAAAVYAQHGDVTNEYLAHYVAWALALEVGEHVDRSPHLARMQALAQPDWHPLRLRYMRSAWAQDERLHGHAEVFLAASREDFARFRAAGAQIETWVAGHLLMLAEHDQGQIERALDVGQTLLDDIRAAGRLRSHAQLLTMHTAMRAAAGDTTGTRTALQDALPLLHAMPGCELLFIAMAWLAAHEGRDEDAAQVLAWFESPARAGGAYGPRTFTRRSADALAAALRQRLGSDRLAALQQAAAGLGDTAAIALGVRQGDAACAPPRTDGNPTPS